MTEDTTPILIGGGQITQRDVDPAGALEPLDLMAEAARRAAVNAGSGPGILHGLDTIAVVNVFCWDYGNAPRLLAERVGAHPTREMYTTIGGNSPQWIVNELAGQVAAGTVRLALVAGAEAVYTLARSRRTQARLAWASHAGEHATSVGGTQLGTNDYELTHNLQLPVQIYPFFENAIRAARGWSLAQHRHELGALCARFSAVAAENPHAWFPQARTAEEIATVTPDNRMIAFPYPKRMNAIIDVDQGAAALVTSVATARALGIPQERWVYLRGVADAHDHWYVSERVSYHTSPAIRAAGQAALAMAGLDVGEVDHFDLYSCFPSAVQIGRDMLGIPRDDPRPLTVTGGLPYFGGPGNNYSLHAIVTMLDRVRDRRGSTGLVSALGWFLTKHSIGVYSAAPPAGPWRRPDPAAPQRLVDADPKPVLCMEPSGAATIETYTVVYGRDGTPLVGLVIGRLADGRRFLASAPDDRDVLESLTTREAVGLPGHASCHDRVGRFDPA
ncbi:MAG: acetyl-CoA acetyltransferase [Candidatus Binatia bacterium]